MPMGPMNDVMVRKDVLMANKCQAMTHFELGGVKILVLFNKLFLVAIDHP
jgi:hypothetical protein